MTLMRTSAPHGDESGFGYYRRLAADNALLNWRELAAVANVARTRAALLGCPDHVSVELGLETGWARSATRQEAVSRSWRGLRRTRGDAICPSCLSEDSYLRFYWEHALAAACPSHRVLLVDRCEACGEPLSAQRERIEQCGCGHDLRTMTTASCTSSQLWLSALIASGGQSTAGTAPKLRPVDVVPLCNLARTFCLFADPSVPPPRRNLISPKSVAETVELLAPLQHFLFDWPKGFEDHVAQRIAAGPPEARTLNQLLGSWYGHLKRACQTKGLEPFLEVVIRVGARDFDGALGLDMASEVAGRVTAYLRIAEAAKEAGVGREQLLGAAKAGLVEHRTSRFGTRGLVYEVPRSEVDRIRQGRAEWVREEEAAGLANVPLSVLHNMMASDVIVSDRDWRRDILKGGPVQRRSLEELLERLNHAAVPHPEGLGDVLSWAELTSRRLGDKRAIHSVMQAAARGELNAARRGRSLGQMQFLREDVLPYFGTPTLEAGMSVHQLAKATGWKWESISYWMELGLLESASIELRGQPCRVVTSQHLLRFRQAYLPLADLAREMGTTSTVLASQLQGLEVFGAKLLPSGVRRGGLVRVAELARLAVIGAAHCPELG